MDEFQPPLSRTLSIHRPHWVRAVQGIGRTEGQLWAANSGPENLVWTISPETKSTFHSLALHITHTDTDHAHQQHISHMQYI